MKLILIGPADTAKGGATVSFTYLLEELDRNGITYECLKTDSTKNDLGIVFELLKHAFKIFRCSDAETVVSLHASNKRAAAYSVALNMATRYTGASLMIRLFGGSHDNYLSSLPSFYRNQVIKSYRNNTLLLQTKGLIKNFEEKFQIFNIKWFPTSRPRTENNKKSESDLSGTLNLLFVGQIREKKGIYDLFEVAKKAEDEELDLLISLYGEPEDDEFLKNISSFSKISYGGILEKEEVIDAMCQSELLIFPTLYEDEGYPGVLIEAINVNLPVIATNQQYTGELIRHKIDGLLYEAGEEQELWKIIKDFYVHREKITAYRQNLDRRKEKFYSEKWNGQVFPSLIAELADKQHPK